MGVNRTSKGDISLPLAGIGFANQNVIADWDSEEFLSLIRPCFPH